MAKGKRPPTTSGSPLAAALTARSLRECESLAGPALNSTPLSAGPCGVTFRSRSVPPSVEAVTSSSQLGGVLSPGDVVAFISLGGETETACATMNGVLPSLPPPHLSLSTPWLSLDPSTHAACTCSMCTCIHRLTAGEDLAAALRAHAESGDRILHWIAGGCVPLASRRIMPTMVYASLEVTHGPTHTPQACRRAAGFRRRARGARLRETLTRLSICSQLHTTPPAPGPTPNRV